MAHFVRLYVIASWIFLLGFGSSVWLVGGSHTTATTNASFAKSPFAVLSASPTATQDEIKRRYRKLCLAYHPDKKRHLPEGERREYERLFKELQNAYAQIGTPEARRQYELDVLKRSSPFANNNNFHAFHANSPEANDSVRQAFSNAFRSHPSAPFGGGGSNSPFYSYFNVNDVTNVRSPFGFFGSTTSPLWNNNPSLKSIYVQTVTVPLQDLYTGQPNFEFRLHDNIVARVKAAFRGGIGQLLLYQSILCSIPVLRFSRTGAALLGLSLFLQNMPRVHPRNDDDVRTPFTANLQPGYKENTKLIFNDERTGQRGVEVHFVLKEGSHSVYRRRGNNLHVTGTISRQQAAAGCQVEIPALHDPDFTLTVTVPPRTCTGDCIVVPGKGWPNRKQKGIKGDLILTVVVGSKWHPRKFAVSQS